MSGFTDSSSNWDDIVAGVEPQQEEPDEYLEESNSGFYDEQEQQDDGYGEREYEEETAPTQEQSYFDVQMSEAEQRLHKATLYRHFLTGRIFTGASDNLTLEVEEEFREFAQHRLSVLLGIGNTTGFGSQFTDTEAKVLKLLAGSAIKNAKVAKAVEQTGSAERPKQKAAPAPAPASRPTLRSRPLPEVARPQKQQPAPRQIQSQPRPQQRPPQRTQPPQQRQQPRPQPRQQPQPRPQQRPPAKPVAQPAPAIPQDGEIFQIAGKNYKAAWVQMGPDEYGTSIAQKLEKLPPGRSVVLPNGIQVMKTEGEEYFKIVKRDLSTQAKSSGAVAFPSVAQMAAISQMKSAEAIQNLPASTQGLISKLEQ